MESNGRGELLEPTEDLGGTNGHATWTSVMSFLMLTHLADLVANGTKTSSGFKKVHYNPCARAVNEKFNSMRTGDQIKNHLKTWQHRFQKLVRLSNLSATGWDEDNYIITLDVEHYNNYVKDHKADAEFLNKPLEHFAEIKIIFRNSMATGKFAKDSSTSLRTEGGENETEEGNATGFSDGVDGAATPENHGATSSASKTNKRAKLTEIQEEGLIGAFNRVGDKLAAAITKVATPDNDVPEDLFDNLTNLPGFNETRVSFYYAYLCTHPHIAGAFNKLPFNHKLN